MANPTTHTWPRTALTVGLLWLTALAGGSAPVADGAPGQYRGTPRAGLGPRCGGRHRAHRAVCAESFSAQRRPNRHRVAGLKAPYPAAHAGTSGSGSCEDVELIPSASDLPQVQAATLCLINEIRAQHGETPLLDNAMLDRAARLHSEDMALNNYFEHTTPSGEHFYGRVKASGYVPPGASYVLGENIDCATLSLATPSATVSAWMNSPEHRANILDGEFRDSGIGVAPAAPAQFSDNEPGATYTQDFGAIVR